MENIINNIFYIVSIISIVILILNFTSVYFTFKMCKGIYSVDNSKIISVLQEIACDYHVRVFRFWHGNIIIDDLPISDTEMGPDDYGYIDMNSDNQIICESKAEIDYDNDKKLYFINFRVLGKCYIAYAKNTTSLWIAVIKKAREMNKKLFYGHLDRHRI